jgi:hypothetical protein
MSDHTEWGCLPVHMAVAIYLERSARVLNFEGETESLLSEAKCRLPARRN